MSQLADSLRILPPDLLDDLCRRVIASEAGGPPVTVDDRLAAMSVVLTYIAAITGINIQAKGES